jgi:hypothetical protein
MQGPMHAVSNMSQISDASDSPTAVFHLKFKANPCFLKQNVGTPEPAAKRNLDDTMLGQTQQFRQMEGNWGRLHKSLRR